MRTILIVDDNVTLARAVGRALTHAGYTTQVAHTAQHGLDLARRHRPDAIILDVGMPFINGIGFLYRLRAAEEPRRTPVLIVTGATLTPDTVTELTDLGALLRTKPVDMECLLADIGGLVTPPPVGPDAGPPAHGGHHAPRP